MKHLFARGGFGYVGPAANLIVTTLCAFLVPPLAAAIHESNSYQKPIANSHSIPSLEQRTLDGETEEVRELAAQQLAQLDGPEATQAMRNVLQRSRDVPVKIAVIQGLGRNKDFQCGPFLFKIMEEDEQLVMLRHMAYLASTRIISDHFYNARAPLEERREKVKEMRAEWKARDDKIKSRAASVGK